MSALLAHILEWCEATNVVAEPLPVVLPPFFLFSRLIKFDVDNWGQQKVTHLHNEPPQIQSLPLVLMEDKNSTYTEPQRQEAQLKFLSPKIPQHQQVCWWPVCYVQEKFHFLSIIGSFILLLVLVPGYLQHSSISGNCMKPRVLCDTLWLLFVFTTSDSFNIIVLYRLNFLVAYVSFHSFQDLTIATCATTLW